MQRINIVNPRYINPKINIINPKINMIDHGRPWLIFILRQYLLECDVGPWLTMIDFDIKRIFVTMWRWSMVHHDWPWLIFILIIFVTMRCWTMVDHSWPWMTMVVTMWNCTVRQSLSYYKHAYWWSLTMI